MKSASFTIRLIILLSVALVGSAWVKGSSADEKSVPCTELESVDFSIVQGAPAQVTQSKEISAQGTLPAYCHVQGYISPTIGFELKLPRDWNGKLLQLGCGGWCGVTDFITLCKDPLRKGYACITSDMGHRSTMKDAKWAYNNLQGQIDFAFRAAHVTALAGKAIAEHYYSKAPRKAYFMGCSQGGRQAMTEAQRFPWDFDGIVAGAPPIDQERNVMTHLWAGRVLTGTTSSAGEARSLLGLKELQWINQAAITQCDMNDGIKDGLIGDPRQCAFDPATLKCGAKSTRCLTPEQITAVKNIYAGPMTSKGEAIYTGGPVIGSELNWAGDFFNPDSGKIINTYADLYRYMAFMPAPGPNWQPSDFDFDRDYQRLALTEAFQASTNPDLRKFKAAGGKLIAHHGWNDAGVPPRHFIDYYETVEKTMGGRDATQDFFRLFMVPGMNHCSGGVGAYAVDYLGYLDKWVEQGQAPDVMRSVHLKEGFNQIDEWYYSNPLDTNTPYTFSRPLYPYPLLAKYKGTGDPNDSANFRPVQ